MSLDRVQPTGSTFDELELEDVVLVDCELSGVTLSGAKLRRVRFERCRLSGLSAAEPSQAVVTALRLERTIIDGLVGIGDLRDVVLSPDVVMDFAVPFLASFGITVDDGTD